MPKLRSNSKKIKYKIGTKVVCLPGFKHGDYDDGGGSGYREGKTFIVDEVHINASHGLCYFEKTSNYGVWEFALSKYAKNGDFYRYLLKKK